MEAFATMYHEGVGILGVQTPLLIVLAFGLAFFTFGVKALRPTPADL